MVRLQCVQDNGCCELKIGMEGHHVLTQLDGVLYGAIGRWRAVDKLELELRNTRMAGGKRFVLQFQGDKLILNADSTIPEAGGLADPLTPEYSFTLKAGDVNTKTKMYWEK